MTTRLNSHLVMLGAAPGTRGSIAAVVDAYRAHGLFKRWPIQYIATSSDGGVIENARIIGRALCEFGAALTQRGHLAVHVHTSAGAGFWRDAVFMSATLAARCPLILQLHGAGFERFHDGADAAQRALIRFFLEQAACVAVPAESLRGWVRSVARNAHAVCVPFPVSVQVRAEAAKPDLVLFLGRLEQAKGIYDLLDAICALRPALPDVRLVCAGDGDRVGVARYADRLGIADVVKFTGWVGPSGKRALLENAAVFALPSYDESLPISLIEAMSAGVPVVVSPVGGIPEVVQDGVSGCFVAPGDKAGLERQIRKLLLDRKLGERLGAAARESARLRFSPERALPRLEDLYASLGVAALGERTPRLREVPLKKAA